MPRWRIPNTECSDFERLAPLAHVYRATTRVTNEEASGMTETVLCDIDQHGVARVTLNRPQLHNAFETRYA
jgi:hypothetical protein